MDKFFISFLNFLYQGETEKAIILCEKAIASNPNQIDNYCYLGIAYLLNGDVETAQASWMSVLFESDDIEKDTQHLVLILDNFGKHFLQKKDLSSAKLIYESVENLVPDQVEKYQLLAYIYRDLKDNINAELIFKKIIENQPNHPNLYIDFSNLLLQQYRYEEIIELLKNAISRFPEEPNLYFSLVEVLTKNGQAEEAILFSDKLLQLEPNNLLFQVENALILPIIYENEKEIDFYRNRFAQCFHKITENLSLITTKEAQIALRAINLKTNFYLAYQGKNVLEPQKVYSDFVKKIVHKNYSQLNQNKQVLNINENAKIRVGYISSKMHDNVIGELFLGWVKYHSVNNFQVYSYYVGEKEDFITEEYKKYSDRFYKINNQLETICQKIISDQLDILVFLDMGMSPKMLQIASLRLAPIQCKGWGPPITSGLDTIDYFLTSDLMEGLQGENHYCEKLVRIPNIAIAYSPPKLPETIKSRSEFNLNENSIVYLSCQSLFKYLPQYDYIFAQIASEVKNCQFIFIKFPLSNYVNNIFQKRLKKAFSRFNLNSEDYCVFSPGLSYNDFLNINSISDICLDTFDWSGGKTAMEAIICDLPIVTCPGKFLRGRHSYGILKMIQVEEGIAYSEQEYIDIAIKLGNNFQYRQKVIEKIKKNKHKLFNDNECIKGLEKFFVNVVKTTLAKKSK